MNIKNGNCLELMKLIKSWEKGFKMDMVWKKRNKTGGLQSRNRPMRNHEMVYFFYDKCPKYNRDKYHKRIQPKKEHQIEKETVYGKSSKMGTMNNFLPPNPASVVEEADANKATIYKDKVKGNKDPFGMDAEFKKIPFKNQFDPKLPASVINEVEDEPVSMFESTKVFIGKRHHQTEKPLDILEFFLKYWTDEGDTVLDPTMGSGSTGVACKNLKRNFIGFELDPKIFKVAEKRIIGNIN